MHLKNVFYVHSGRFPYIPASAEMVGVKNKGKEKKDLKRNKSEKELSKGENRNYQMDADLALFLLDWYIL